MPGPQPTTLVIKLNKLKSKNFVSNWLEGRISRVQEKNREKLFWETRGFIYESIRGNNEQIIWLQAWKIK